MKIMSSKLLSTASVLGVGLLTLGCSGDQPDLVPLQGKVSFDGKPLTAGSIHFHPVQSNTYTGDVPSSLLQLDGSFTAKTFPYGDGVPVGQYKVTLAPALASRVKKPKLGKPETTSWTIDVPTGGIVGHEFVVPK